MTRTVQVRLSDQEYETLQKSLDPKETVSDFVRRAIRLQTVLRMLEDDD